MATFTEEYKNLLIKQYWGKTKAPAEIELQASTWERIFDLLASFPVEFDLDEATNDRLDIIGKIVGIGRIVNDVVPKVAFGFEENTNARGFDDKFTPLADRAPFADKRERQYTDLELDDNNYRLVLYAQIAKNVADPYLAGTDSINIQNTITSISDGLAYVIDNYDMTLTMYISPSIDETQLRMILTNLDAVPRPQGVRYYVIIQAAPGETFGFADNEGALPFANKFDLATEPGGRFAEKVIL